MPLGETLVIVTFCLIIGFIAWVVATNIRRSNTAKFESELRVRLLEKFSSGQELTEYLQTEAGRNFLVTEKAQTGPARRILGAVQAGAILTVLGGGLLSMAWIMGRNAFFVAGMITVSLGVGFLVSAAASYRLSTSWGLLDHRQPEQR